MSNTFTKKISTTTYIINVHYPKQAQEKVEDKLLRIIKNDAAKRTAAS